MLDTLPLPASLQIFKSCFENIKGLKCEKFESLVVAGLVKEEKGESGESRGEEVMC